MLENIFKIFCFIHCSLCSQININDNKINRVYKLDYLKSFLAEKSGEADFGAINNEQSEVIHSQISKTQVMDDRIIT